MANYSTSWSLPPAFMACDSSSNGSASMVFKPTSELHMKKHGMHGANGLPKDQAGDDGILYVTIHHAKQIHNICIYGNQDVYAKFILTHCQDVVYPTQPVKAGGQNPVFNQTLEIPVHGRDAILRCELWMMSCARNYLEDQLLGFVLVPLKSLHGKGKQTQEYCLTSTDLFYTPAGTVYLSLAFCDHDNTAKMMPSEDEKLFCPPSPEFHEVMMDCGQQSISTANLCKVEFLDLEAASEDQHLISMYYKLAANGAAFEECSDSNSLVVNSRHGNTENGHAANGKHFESDAQGHREHGLGLQNRDQQDLSKTVLLAHLQTPPMGSVDHEMLMSPKEKKSLFALHEMPVTGSDHPGVEQTVGSPILSVGTSTDSSSECKVGGQSQTSLEEVQAKEKGRSTCQADGAVPYSAPLVNISVEPETPINQEHFVDLYLKSMQQFTDKLADMKFSFDIESQDLAALRSVHVDKKVLEGKKKEGSKLYYGSSAFY